MKNNSDSSRDSLNRRTFLRSGAVTETALILTSKDTAKSAPHPDPFPLLETGITEMAAGLQSGRWTVKDLTQWYLHRIESIDSSGPSLGSVIEVNPEALAIAEVLDKERKVRGSRGPLHGIPILLKDNLDTADRMKTTAGSLALKDAPPPQADAFLVGKLRKAGALILGKTNLSEWANFRSTRSISGWSGRGGQTRNPYALDRNPSGSSSGSAVAVAANLCAAAIGTETDGSIVSPANNCGVVGLKPTVGLLSRSGIIPIAHSQDTAGPITRSVRDAAILLSILAGSDPRDLLTQSTPAGLSPDYTRFLAADGLKGARIGILQNLLGKHTHVDKIMKNAWDTLRRSGATLVEVVHRSQPYEDAELEVLLYEFKTGLNGYLQARGGSVDDLTSLIAFNEKYRAAEMPYFEQEILLQAQEKGPLTEKKYLEALAACRKLCRSEGLDVLMVKNRLDALAAPTGSPAWLTDPINGDSYGISCSTPAAVAGYPHITVPAGFVFGLPVGLSFFGRPWSEPMLIQFAYAFEQTTRIRRPPQFAAGASTGA